MKRPLAVLLICGVLFGCGYESANQASTTSTTSARSNVTLSDVVTDLGVRTWVSMTGLTGPDLKEWENRLLEACRLPIWDIEAGLVLASRYVEEDGGDPNDPDLVDTARQALWLMTVQPQVCREEFPQSVIDAGPFN